MAFNNEDILILAKAGFNAQQIAALNMVGTQPAPAPAQAPETPPAPAPAPAPAPETPPAPAAPQGATMDEILKSVQGLTQTFQNGFIMGAQQPKPVTAEDILANIINPPSTNKEV
jgi:hypothetical protein